MRRSALLVAPFLAVALLATPAQSARQGGSAWPDLSRPAAKQGGGAHDAAVVIGVGRYDVLPPVPGAAEVATDWQRYLTLTRGARPSRVKLLTDDEARREYVEDAIDDAVAAVGPRGTLWFVFIGHGAPSPARDDGVLVTYDATGDPKLLYARSLSQADLLERLARGRQARTVVVLDACFSGQATGSGEALAPGLQPLIPTSLPTVAAANLAVLTAGRPNQLAGPLPGTGRPAFSYLVLGAIRGWADRSAWSREQQDGRVTAGEAVAYAREVLAILEPSLGRKQEPQLAGEGGGITLSTSAREVGPTAEDMLQAAGGARRSADRTTPDAVDEVGRIRPEVGMLRVEGSPRGAEVTIEGPARFGRRPLKTRLPWGPEAVPAGSYAVTATAEGHGAETRRLQVAADRTEVVQFALEPATGVLVVSGEPRGARAVVRCAEGFRREFGLPGRLTVPRGTCDVVVERAGYERFTSSVSVRGGTTERIPVSLRHVPRRRETTGAGIAWLRVRGGTFRMGSDAGVRDETPVHAVRVATFDIARTEVTVAQYAKCVSAGACSEPGTGRLCNWGRGGRDDHPVNCVRKEQAEDFSRWVGGRLPTEAEWEYAARRGGTARVYPWGDRAPTCASAVLTGDDGACSPQGTAAVCSRRPDRSGKRSCDLAGNVAEWVQDCYHGSFADAPDDASAWREWCEDDAAAVVRGGSWVSDAWMVRTTARDHRDASGQFADVGFRPVRTR